MAYGTPNIQTHEQWLGLVQPVGLVVAPAVLAKLDLFPNQRTAYLSALQLQLEALLEEVDSGPKDQPVKVVASFQQLATELLAWGDSDLVAASALEKVPEVVLSEYGETLRPTHGVPKEEGAAEGSSAVMSLQALVLDLTQWRDASGKPDPQWNLPFDEPWNPTGNGWDATPQQRFERLLKETEHPIGLLFNGSQLRLVHAPRGESSGHITLPLEPMAEVAGRPMLGALEMLLGVDRLFGGNPAQRLPALLAASRKNQNEVSTRLAEQVLEALWELLLGFDAAERLAQDSGRNVLGDLPKSEEGQKHLYGGLITVLLRLVFLLYAEDEELMPRDSLYGQHYSVSALADRLRQERFEHQSAMADRRGAWASLLSLFRLVYDGGGADPAYLPARHGELFDPDAYPFLEGRNSDSSYDDGILTNLPAVSDDVIEKVLSKLIWLDGERLSYRALDVEQIGSVYEGIMGFTVEGATGPSVGITYRPPRQKITITVVVDADQLLAQGGSKREKWLDEQAGVALKLPAKVKSELKSATTLAGLCLALDKKLSPHTPNGLESGSLILQPTAERRRSGSHYTPRALTEPIVAEAFRPWLERCNHQPTAEQILALKVCDPAMGSGAFLVAVCRYLAVWLVQAWERQGYPEGFRQDWDKDTVARRLIAQRCLYGVDKNPFAVNLAKLSLWLVTLSKEQPFTFVDHALKCGDSLVGYSVKEIQAAINRANDSVQLAFFDDQNRVYAKLAADRGTIFSTDNLKDEDYDRKRILLQRQLQATEGLRQAGDLMVAGFFEKQKPHDREARQRVYLGMLSGAFNDDGVADSLQEARERLAMGEKGITPFHWDLEFPEVFTSEGFGFTIVVGNPPFLGGPQLSEILGGSAYQEWLKSTNKDSFGHADLAAYFFRRSFSLLSSPGAMGLIATKTISEGSTRTTGLKSILESGGKIFSTTRSLRWPGVASVIVSVAHILKGANDLALRVILDGEAVKIINSRLQPGPELPDPKPLHLNEELAFMGIGLGGSGFVLQPDEYEIYAHDKPNLDVLMPLLGGEEVNTHPLQLHSRYAVNFKKMTLQEAERYADLLELVRERVRPERELARDHGPGKHGKKYWWQHTLRRDPLYEAIAPLNRCIVCAITTAHLAFTFAETNQVFVHSLVIFPFNSYSVFACLQSKIHLAWAEVYSSNLGSTMRYSVRDCFQTFPLPIAFLEYSEHASDECVKLEDAGKACYDKRSAIMEDSSKGLTSVYNSLNDPAVTSNSTQELRRLHVELDQAVLNIYGWNDIATSCGFGIDQLDLEEDADLPEELQERIDSGNLFFWDANDALDFQGQLQAYGAITGRRKLPWRYRWPDAVRGDVLARLLALNAERYAEEVAMGLHSKSRSRTTASTQTAAQIGLKL